MDEFLKGVVVEVAVRSPNVIKWGNTVFVSHR
jgi:hypothetical protein